MSLMIVVALGTTLLYASGNILPGVGTTGIELGGLSETEATNKIAERWQSDGILLRDGDRTWRINPLELGINIDASTTANEAQRWGRQDMPLIGGIEALIMGTDIDPQLLIDLNQTATKLESLRGVIEQPPRNAGIQLVNGQAQITPPINGRILDTSSTLAALQANAADELANGVLDLQMTVVTPNVTDATPLLREAEALLTSSLQIEAYDPIADESYNWSALPETWSQWLVASTPSENSPALTLSLDRASLQTYLNQRTLELPDSRHIDLDASINTINAALGEKQLSSWIRVYHHPTTYTVNAGETLSSIGYDLGIPFPWLQAANPGLGSLNPGQVINIPSKDDLLPLPIIRHKRIVVSIPEQELWAYENGELIYNWVISTGIARSPTAPGIFQVQSHEINAYAAQWNLYMPHFMGVYEPGPNAGVMNGFHGFPTDATGGYLLWTNNLGTPATYGCILLSLENAEILYDWAEEGVIVEIIG